MEASALAGYVISDACSSVMGMSGCTAAPSRHQATRMPSLLSGWLTKKTPATAASTQSASTFWISTYALVASMMKATTNATVTPVASMLAPATPANSSL